MAELGGPLLGTLAALLGTGKVFLVTLGGAVPRNSRDVPRNAPVSRPDEDGGQKRSERLRARRDEAGLAQVSGWVPKERRAYAREVIAALARGANSLPPDPEQVAALEAAQAEAAAARAGEVSASAALALAEQHGQALATELEAARAAAEAVQQASYQAEAAALARADTAEQAWKDALDQMQAAQAAAAQARVEAERFRQAPGLRGWIVRRLVG